MQGYNTANFVLVCLCVLDYVVFLFSGLDNISFLGRLSLTTFINEVLWLEAQADLKNPYGRMDIVRRWFRIPQALFDIFKFWQGLCLTFLSFI